MRAAPVAILMVFAACVPAEEPPTRQLPSDDACGSAKLQLFVGVPFDERDFDVGDRPLRILPPGSAMTMDHNPARLNVNLDEEGTVTRIWCG